MHLKGYGELDFQSIQHIIDNCVGLNEINLSADHLSEDSMNYLVNNLRPSMKKLSLGKMIEVRDNHIGILVRRCNILKDLSLHQTSITNHSISNIIEHLRGTLEKLDVGSTNTDHAKILELRSMPFLKVLTWFPKGRPSSRQAQNLKNKFPEIIVNERPKQSFGFDFPKNIGIGSSNQLFPVDLGFWEIEAKRLPVFRKNYWK